MLESSEEKKSHLLWLMELSFELWLKTVRRYQKPLAVAWIYVLEVIPVCLMEYDSFF